MSIIDKATLAKDDGTKIREKDWPARFHFGEEEMQASINLYKKSINSGSPFGYNGKEEAAFCEEFADMMGGGYCDAVNSGTTAVYVALRSLNLEPFTEVIVSCVTDPGGMMPIAMLNCIPVPADIETDSYNIGPEQIEPLINERTSAIVVAHISGQPADIEGIAALAKKHNLKLVEDCAQAHYAKVNGKMVGTFGDVASFSLMFGKHCCCGGQGGMVYTKHGEIYQQIRWASDRGKPFGLKGANNQIASLNFNIDELGCAVGRVQIKKLPKIVSKRRSIVKRMRDKFSSLKSIEIPEEKTGVEASYWFLVTKFNNNAVICSKDEFLDAVREEGISPIVNNYTQNQPYKMDWCQKKQVFGNSGYPWASPEYKGDPDAEYPCPNTELVSKSYFNISFNESWTDEEINDCFEAFKKVERFYSK